MEHTAPETVSWEGVPVGRLLRVGAVAAALSTSANALVLAIASSLLGAVVIPPDETVTFGQVAGASVAGAVGAVVIFAVISRFIGARSASSWVSRLSVCFFRSFRSPWRALRGHLRGRWPLCTWWPRPPTSACSWRWTERGRAP
jgi:hypothetical protein